MVATYSDFLERKLHTGADHGFEPVFMPPQLFDFQQALIQWAVRKGRAAIFADCGLGKTAMQLTWAENVARHTGRPVLILTPLAVAAQTVREGEKFGIECHRSSDGSVPGRIVVSNYDRLHLFDPSDFGAVVCDESSILKSFNGSTRKAITRFMAKMPYRLLCTATAAPNDYTELGNSSEALGELSYSDMLRRFFAQLDDKGQKREERLQQSAEAMISANANYYKKLAFRVSQTIGQWRLKHHAREHFWRWVASWARACRMPSDIGYSNDGFVLPPLVERDHIIAPAALPDGMLFSMPAFGLAEEREERKRTIRERCEFAAQLVDHDCPAVIWCHTNAEGDLLEELIPDAAQVAGRTPDDRKVQLYEAFAAGHQRVLIIKPKIGAWGLNWQHCAHVVTFASHSYEQYYQSVRRCWRFGQQNTVELDVIATEGEARVLANMRSKAERASAMFEELVGQMNNATTIKRTNLYTNTPRLPQWL
jgi:superfamily II DNA or RNA helicase